jgi:hypothetical protein
VREFSLIVYNDTYEENNKEAARAQLTVDKVIALSLACNDNDNPSENPKTRENMIGSVWEPQPGNMHWENANYFGNIKLVAGTSSSVSGEHAVQPASIKLFPNPATSSAQLQVENSYRGKVSIRLFNLLGQEVFRTATSKSDRVFTQTLMFDRLPAGVYFLQTQMGRSVFREKVFISHR